MKKYKDPVTGDTLTVGEHVSWMIQGVIRRWLFLGVITILTSYVWVVADPIWNHQVTDQWNLWASYLALVIEGVTAMALINQTRRDAVIIREIRANGQRQLTILSHIEQQSERVKAIEKKTGVLAEKIKEVK